MIMFFFFKQKTAYEMRISDWSSDVCSSDLRTRFPRVERHEHGADRERAPGADRPFGLVAHGDGDAVALADAQPVGQGAAKGARGAPMGLERQRSEEHTSELQSLMRISYAVFCWKNKKKNNRYQLNVQPLDKHNTT